MAEIRSENLSVSFAPNKLAEKIIRLENGTDADLKSAFDNKDYRQDEPIHQ